MSITTKVIIGYVFLSLLLIVVSIFALSNLKRLNSINESILKTDVPLIDSSDKMIDNILAQDFYVRRYAILKSSDMLVLFWQRSEEFNKIAEHIHNLPGQDKFPLNELTSLHDQYNYIFMAGIEHIGKGSHIGEEHNIRIKKKQEELITYIKKISSGAMHDQKLKAEMTASIGSNAFRITAALCILGLSLSVGLALLITRNISGAINQLKIATQHISEGKFDYEPTVCSKDELGELSNAFGEMGKRLKRLEEMYLDASPLTRLPGGIAIENVLNKRLDADTSFAFCLIDLDNFKPFSDRYGYARGSELIKATARIIEEAVKMSGTENDFIGHIGGDDFVLISAPERYDSICKAVIEAFDKMVRGHYDAEDVDRGHIAGHTRQGDAVNFPLMTISIAVVTNKERKYANAVEIGEVAAELKEYAKSQHGSIYVVNKRKKGLSTRV